MSGRRPLGLYLHIPFCASKCVYCDFASYPHRETAWEPYLCALCGEMASWRERMEGHEVISVFLGGGTPSLLSEAQIARLLESAASQFRISPDAEITMESNPGTLTLSKLRACRAAGVNRLSLGVQAMDDRLLRRLGRIHTVREAVDAVEMARTAGFDNVSLDLMYVLPGQSRADWRSTLRDAVALEPEHISAYSLIVEEGTPLARQVARGEAELPDEDAAVDMHREAVHFLSEAGYERYEISNYARPGRACRHNIIYWERGEYLGLGCAAHSLVGETRFENPRDLDRYLAGERQLNVEHIDRQEAMEETLMLATRMCRGMNLADYRRQFGEDFLRMRMRTLERLRKMGLVEWSADSLWLTERGLELQNAVVVELLEEETRE